MTVQNAKSIIIHATDGVQLIFGYDFIVLDENHLFVVDNSGLITTGFTIQGIGEEEGGTITFDPDAPDSGPLAIARFVPMTQLVDYQPFDAFPAETHELALDLNIMAVQQLATMLGVLTPVSGSWRFWQYTINVEDAPNIVPAPIAGEGRAIILSETEISIGPTLTEIANAEANAIIATQQADRAEAEADRAQATADAGANVIVGGVPIPNLIEAKLYVNNDDQAGNGMAMYFQYNDGTGQNKMVEIAASVPRAVDQPPPPPDPQVFTGQAMLWTGIEADIPVGWEFCDGRELSRVTFGGLFSVISTDFGIGDGADTFNIPDFRDVSVLGALVDGDRNNFGGNKEIIVDSVNLPEHTHFTHHNSRPSGGGTYRGASGESGSSNNYTAKGTNSVANTYPTSPAGGEETPTPVNIENPFRVGGFWIIKT